MCFFKWKKGHFLRNSCYKFKKRQEQALADENTVVNIRCQTSANKRASNFPTLSNEGSMFQVHNPRSLSNDYGVGGKTN